MLGSPCALELFAGSCKLSNCLKAHGFAAFGIDHKKCKNRVGPCVILDLSRAESRNFLMDLKSGQVKFALQDPPCQTSRARERRLGLPEPKPLSTERPIKLPGFTGGDLFRVDQANACHALGIYSFIAKTTKSRLWELPIVKALFALPNVHFTTFHACMHGADRDKSVSLSHNYQALRSLACKCNKKHRHKPWSFNKSFLGGWKCDPIWGLSSQRPRSLWA